MRKFVPLLGVLSVSMFGACAQMATRWEKPQASEQAVAADLDHCRVQAQQEAVRSVGPYPAGYPFYGPPFFRGYRYDYEARLRQEQYFAESRLTSFCMRNKGYERVAVETPKQ